MPLKIPCHIVVVFSSYWMLAFVYVVFFLGWAAVPLPSNGGRWHKAPRKTSTSSLAEQLSLSHPMAGAGTRHRGRRRLLPWLSSCPSPIQWRALAQGTEEDVDFFLGWAAVPIPSNGGRWHKAPRKTSTSSVAEQLSLSHPMAGAGTRHRGRRRLLHWLSSCPSPIQWRALAQGTEEDVDFFRGWAAVPLPSNGGCWHKAPRKTSTSSLTEQLSLSHPMAGADTRHRGRRRLLPWLSSCPSPIKWRALIQGTEEDVDFFLDWTAVPLPSNGGRWSKAPRKTSTSSLTEQLSLSHQMAGADTRHRGRRGLLPWLSSCPSPIQWRALTQGTEEDVNFFLDWAAVPLPSNGGRWHKAPRKTSTSTLAEQLSLSHLMAGADTRHRGRRRLLPWLSSCPSPI